MPHVTVNEDRCKSCGLCVSVCPKKILAISKDKLNRKGHHPVRVTDMDACIGCAACQTMCPDYVLTVEREARVSR